MTEPSAPITTEARKSAIQAAVQAARDAVQRGQGTSDEIRWKGGKIVLPVASVDVDLVLLSRDSHRIKAQLQSLPQAEQETVHRDPYGTAAQAIIARLLSETSGYEQIKNALDNSDGQLEAGVLTTGGVLVNANTRVVALRELRQKYVKVVVLPEDAGPKEITELELRLQMEQTFKQDYSFTSQLLFIEDLVNSGNYTIVEIGQLLNPSLTNSRTDRKKAQEHVQGQLRMLGLIRDIQGVSGGALSLIYFDDKQQALSEIDENYQKLKNTNPEEAARIRDARLTGLIADIGYRKLRDIDTTLMDSYIRPALEENSRLAPHLEALLSADAPSGDDPTPDGLDLLDDENEEPMVTGPSLSSLYTLLAKTKPDEDITIPDVNGTSTTLPRNAIVADLFSAFTTAIENKKRDTRQLDQLTAPMILLKDAAKALDRATEAYADVHQQTGFNRSGFLQAVQELQRAAAEFTTATGTAPIAVTRPANGDGTGSEVADA